MAIILKRTVFHTITCRLRYRARKVDPSSVSGYLDLLVPTPKRGRILLQSTGVSVTSEYAFLTPPCDPDSFPRTSTHNALPLMDLRVSIKLPSWLIPGKQGLNLRPLALRAGAQYTERRDARPNHARGTWARPVPAPSGPEGWPRGKPNWKGVREAKPKKKGDDRTPIPFPPIYL